LAKGQTASKAHIPPLMHIIARSLSALQQKERKIQPAGKQYFYMPSSHFAKYNP